MYIVVYFFPDTVYIAQDCIVLQNALCRRVEKERLQFVSEHAQRKEDMFQT